MVEEREKMESCENKHSSNDDTEMEEIKDSMTDVKKETDRSSDDTDMEQLKGEEKDTLVHMKKDPKDLEATLFRSDDFKIEVQNLPRHFGIGQLKKLFNKKLKLNSHKIKPCGPGSTYL